MNGFIAALLPNRIIDKRTMSMLLGAQIVTLGVVWVFSPFVMLPTPGEVWQALAEQWQTKGLGYNLLVSFSLNLQAIAVAVLASLGLSYLSVVPFIRPLVMAITKLRFLSMVGLSVAFELTFNSKHEVKLAMLAFSVSVFLITSVLDVIKTIPREQYDLARTLRMSEWRVVWEVVVLGQIDKVFDSVRQNASIGWMMLTMVETVAFSEGGVGTMLQTMQLHARFSDIMAIQIMILMVGLGQDYLLGAAKKLFCPYAFITTEKR